MVSLKLVIAIIGAFTATISTARAPHGGHRHRRAAAYYSNNGTATTGIIGTGTGAPLEPVVTPTTYMTSTTSYVTVTYTLGDGRAITKTITKTIEMPTTAYETHYFSTALVSPSETETTTVFHFVPSAVPTTLYSGSTTASVFHTDTEYQTEGPVAEPTAIAPMEHVEQLTTKTVVTATTSTEIVHITKTFAPPAPVYPVASSSSLSVVKLPPYANYTMYTTVKDTKPTTFKLYSTDKFPAGPTGTGSPGCRAGHMTTVTESVVTTVAGPTTIKTVYEYY